ncbi:Fe-S OXIDOREDUCTASE [Thermogutta terrifontis]|uniref:Fe-S OXIDOREDUCTASE n=1 Tax=Thermogutta terrifontis TaxID=1331910 RepID=A0A286RKJ3_9BACT|nr:YgiQ family radical SAM protein [Thermogutta terrifontis]ASV76458.1 Fe-S OXIDOREDUCTASE [Thermogutta terrifontis]
MPAIPKKDLTNFLPMTREEMEARGWDYVDVVFVTGDAYVDHPSFAMALLGRLMEAEGYQVAILSQPDWHSCEPWKKFGRPRLCFAVSAGNMDSMVNHYTANRKVRNDDAYSPGGRIGLRPDRATLAYCQRAREAYKGVPVIAGGVEASLRRIAHYDYWSDKVRRSILLDSKADLLVYGMGERPLLEILRRLAAGEPIKNIRDVRGTAYRLGASEKPPEDAIYLPSYEEVVASKEAFARMTKMAHLETNPYNARRLVQYHDREAVVINPPAFPLTEEEMDRVYGLPFQRRPHPLYGDEPIPAFEVVKHSVQIMRGCFGGCTFCSITAHEGRIIQSRSPQSIIQEIERLKQDPEFKGVISDIGGPTANMYRMNCSRPEVREKCRRLSCIHPTICKLLNTSHGPLIELLKQVRHVQGIKKVYVASGIRMDLAQLSPAYMNHLVRYHVGGHLKVAPEHCDPDVLRLMKKPSIEDFERFAKKFHELSRAAGKEQYLVPYFISGHPGCDLKAMIRLAEFLKRTGYRPQQVQDFMPTPFDIATCMYYTGIDPMTGEKVYVPRGERERRLQRALLQFWKPENYFLVREALQLAGRTDLIGSGPQCLIPSRPPKEALVARRKSQHERTGAEHPTGMKATVAGYRPHRKTFRRRTTKKS